MVMLAQVIPFSIGSIFPLIINILFSTITILFSAQVVLGNPDIQNSFLFSIISYIVLILLGFLPIPSIPFINTLIAIEIVIKSFLIMKLFGTDFRGGVSTAGVQMLFGMILILPF